jgi:hypothetical protein
MVTRTLGVGALVAVFAAVPGTQPAQPAPQSPIFTIQSDDFWLNLHHFLYVLGRAELRAPDASRAAVATYAAGLSRKDAISGDPLPAIAGATASAGDQPTLANVDGGLARTARLDARRLCDQGI